LEKNRRREALLKRMAEKESAAVSLAKIEGKKLILEVKESILNELYKRVKSSLEQLERDDRYLDNLARFAVEAVREIGSSKVYIQLNETDRDLIKKEWRKFIYKVSKELGNIDIELMDKSIDIMGGLLAYSEDGAQIFNNSLDARLERIFSSERNMILTRLFGE
jgi:vacuolar-type H+-ATPase subunit E/Vma4